LLHSPYFIVVPHSHNFTLGSGIIAVTISFSVKFGRGRDSRKLGEPSDPTRKPFIDEPESAEVYGGVRYPGNPQTSSIFSKPGITVGYSFVVGPAIQQGHLTAVRAALDHRTTNVFGKLDLLDQGIKQQELEMLEFVAEESFEKARSHLLGRYVAEHLNFCTLGAIRSDNLHFNYWLADHIDIEGLMKIEHGLQEVGAIKFLELYEEIFGEGAATMKKDTYVGERAK